LKDVDLPYAEQLQYAVERSGFFKERFGANSRAFTAPEDLRREELRWLCVRPEEVSRIVTLSTSGSSGDSKRVYFTEHDLELTVKFFVRGMKPIVAAGERMITLFPNTTPDSVGDLLSRAVRKNGVDVVDDPLIADCAVGSPGQILALPQTRLKTVLLSAEYVSETARSAIREKFGCKIFEHYGLTESGFGFAVSHKPDVDYYEVRSEDIYVEIIDPATLENLPDGESGEVVFSTLNRQAMPFIRYRTGDIAAITGKSDDGRTLLSRVGDRAIVKRARI
jgi:phenylacetate-coenzyme A ligase PaaK-like adenylate-forming protein